ncbi:hypothetical protein [[Eubacterium] hominis]|uniref:leucine-rich repeat domain-containing protein n=1 Tax=[Eubacterium] hominis TaxID=2764325 RepID=UPI0022E84BC3
MKKRDEKKAVVCALCLGLACSSNLGMLNIHAVETKAPETVVTKSDETQETWVNVTEFSDEIITSTKGIYGETNFNDQGQMRVDNVEQVSISNTPITNLNKSLKGIDKLPNVVELYLTNSGLSGDITLPKIDNLTYLEIAYNNIKNLNLENTPKLKELIAQNNGVLESINLNNNTDLTNLNVSNNSLTILDISNNTKLEKVNAQNDGQKGLLKEIKLGSEYPNLTSLSFYNNHVESFDFSKLTSDKKITVNGKYNKLKYADLSGIQSKNKSTNFDLSGNNLLGYDLGENFNGRVNITGQLPTDVEMNEKGEVNLADYGLTTKDFKSVKNVNGNCDYNSETGIFSNIKDSEIIYNFESSGKSMEVTMYVTQKSYINSWIKEPTIASYNLLEEPQPKAEAKYGMVEFKYSKDNETFDSNKPNSAGTWYMKAYVKAGESYTGLESESKKFEVKKANGSAIVEIEGWSEGEKPNLPVIKTEAYKPEERHISYKNNDTGEISSTPPKVAGSYSVIVDFYENDIYRGLVIKKNFMVEKEKQKEEELIKMIINLGDSSYFKLSDVNIDSLTSENEKEIKESLKGATYENGKFININGNVVTFHYTLGNTICNYNLEIVRNSNQPVIVTMDIKAETDKDGNIYLKDLNLKNYKDEYASNIKSSCVGAKFDNGRFYDFENNKFEFAYNVNAKLAYQYRVTITKDNTVIAPDVKPEEPAKPVKPTKPADNKGDKDKPKDAVVKDTSATTQDHTAGLLMGFVTLAGAVIITNKKHEKE